MKYWKKYDNKFYSFEEVYQLWQKLWKENKFPAIHVQESEYIQNLTFDKTNLPAHIEELVLPLWAMKSNKWEILIPDDERNQKAEEIAEWILDDLNFELDTRYWHLDRMTIKDWWLNLNDQLIDEDVAFDIMMWLKESKRLNKNSRNLVYSRLNNKK